MTQLLIYFPGLIFLKSCVNTGFLGVWRGDGYCHIGILSSHRYAIVKLIFLFYSDYKAMDLDLKSIVGGHLERSKFSFLVLYAPFLLLNLNL